MYKKIMVPLDGSELAECVLPHLEAFIERFDISDVVLARVVEPESLFYGGESAIDLEILAKREESRQINAKEYLDKVAQNLKHERTAVHSIVLLGRATESLVGYADKNGVDLFIVGTHGRSGVTRWVMGSVAEKLLRSLSVPVLMIRAAGTKGGI